MIMAKKKSTETSENAVVNQENKEPKKKQEDILLEMIQRYRIPYEKRNLYPYPQNERKTGSLQFERQSAENQAQKYVQG